MDLRNILPRIETNTTTLLLSSALHYATTGTIDFKHIDADGMAIAMFAVIAQLEKEHPGICEKYGWTQLDKLTSTENAIANAVQATPPPGLN